MLIQGGGEKIDSVDEKKLDKLTKQYGKCCKDVVSRAGTIRTFPYGMDRYRRYYWCLPSFKGILVESHESAVHQPATDPTDNHLTLEQLSQVSTDVNIEANTPVTLNTSSEAPPVNSGSGLAVSAAEQVVGAADATSADVGAKVDQLEIKPSIIKHNELKHDIICKSNCEGNNSSLKSAATIDSSTACCKPTTTSSSGTSPHLPPNGFSNSPHSIASWLSSTIDNIFTQQKSTGSPSQSSITSSQGSSGHLTAATISNDLPGQPTHNSTSDSIDPWFDLDRYVCAE